ncbi:hypothetical protein ACHAPT_000887 [Fusarium lateritium]
MYATRLFQLLLVALSVVCVAQATWIDMDKVHKNERRIVRRASPSQANEVEPSSAVEETKPSDTKEEENSASAPPAPTQDTDKQTSAVETAKPSEPTNKDSKPSATEVKPAPETSAAAEPEKETSAAAEPTNKPAASKPAEKTTANDAKPAETAASSAPDDSQPSAAPSPTNDNEPAQSTQEEEAPAATTSASNNSGNQDQDDDASSSDSNNDEPSKTAEEKGTRTTAKPVTSTFIDVVTRTNSDGNLETMTTTSVTTSTPGLSSDGSESSSGMSPKTRNTVIGVVVGIGGAIVVGALAVVAWRIWGRKKHNDEADGLMIFNETNNSSGHVINSTNGAYHSVEKTEPSSIGSAGPPGRTPFQATLDNYHQPTQVNASSNF